MSEQSTTLNEAARMRLPNVDEVVNLGHAMHLADDSTLEGKHSQTVARNRVKLFLEIQTDAGTPERAYYECVSDIANSIGRGITRRKEQYLERLETALEERNFRKELLRESRKGGRGLNAGWYILRPLALFVGGILIAQILGIFTPIGTMVHTAAAAQSSSMAVGGWISLIINMLASFLAGIAFLLVGKSISIYWASYKSAQIGDSFRSMCYLAELAYEEAKLRELTLFRRQLCQAWKLYTGEEYPDTISYQNVTESDILARHRIEQRAELSSMSDLRALVRFIKRIKSIGSPRKPLSDTAPA